MREKLKIIASAEGKKILFDIAKKEKSVKQYRKYAAIIAVIEGKTQEEASKIGMFSKETLFSEKTPFNTISLIILDRALA